MRVILWATHLQTDILALASYLDASPDVELMVVTPDAARFQAEPYARANPLSCRLLDRNQSGVLAEARNFAADVVVADNHLPPSGLAPRLFYMWHGMGWKARSQLDVRLFRKQVKQLTGIDPSRPNPRFMAQCYGPTDLAWRVGDWRLDRSNCVEIGMAFSDVLLSPPYGRAAAADTFAIDVANRKTVLFSITWHYGGIFARSGAEDGGQRGADIDLLERLADSLALRDANLLLCLHDRKRYDPVYLAGIEEIAARHDHVELRFKSDHPDNLADLLVADVMVSNLSSFLAYHYVSGRPSIHITPASGAKADVERVFMFLSRFRIRRKVRSDKAWMIAPDDVGGAIARTGGDVVRLVEAALDDPAMHHAAASSWLERHVMPLDGNACARFKKELENLCGV